ncbi:MAG: hypothetical protein ACREQ2_26725 [Candidatus Binatia bacterium]
MKNIARISLALAIALAISACGDKQDAADKAQEAQKAIQQGMQKEKAMIEGMQKGVDDIQKKMTEQEAKK